MILITQTDKKQYHAIEVPMDAEDCEIETHWRSIPYLCFHYESIPLRYLKKPEIIGIQGGGESLSEEQAIEVLYHNDLQAYEYDGSEALQFLKVVLKDLGIETENPYKKPEEKDYGFVEQIGFDEEPSFWAIEEGEEEYYKSLKLWEQAESKLKKVVIIKSDI